jgi:hypothetical protein
LFDARSKVGIWRVYIGVHEASLFTKRAACKIFLKNRKQANCMRGVSFLATTSATTLLDTRSKIGVWRARGITFHKTSGVQDFREKSKTSKRRARDVIFSDDAHTTRTRPAHDPHTKIGVWRAGGITFHKTSGVQDFREKSKTSKRRARDVIFSDDAHTTRTRPVGKNRRLAYTRHDFSQNERRARFS